MSSAIESYFAWLEWIPNHPVQAFFILVIEFLVLMKIYHHFDQNKWLKLIFGTLYTPQNFIANATIISIIGLEFPREPATTLRMKRWKKLDPTHSALHWWRYNFATTLCRVLNWADKGHC